MSAGTSPPITYTSIDNSTRTCDKRATAPLRDIPHSTNDISYNCPLFTKSISVNTLHNDSFSSVGITVLFPSLHHDTLTRRAKGDVISMGNHLFIIFITHGV